MKKSITAYCGHCKKDVSYHYEPVNHLKQLVLSVVTLGLWLPMWLCATYLPTRLCDQCNQPIWD